MRLRLGQILAGCLAVSALACCGCNEDTGLSRSTPNTAPLVNSVGMTMVYLESGEFTMGSEDEAVSAELLEAEKPRPVRIDQAFRISESEVTRKQFADFLSDAKYEPQGPHAERLLNSLNGGSADSVASAQELPVVFVNWHDANAFCEWLSKKEGRQYRLPSVELWEYACRAGAGARFCYGDDATKLGRYAWFKDNADGRAHRAKRKLPNAWDLYDMHGNVFEWCETPVPSEMAEAADYGKQNCAFIKGGCYRNVAMSCRCPGGWAFLPKMTRDETVGFRIVCDP